MMDLNQFELKWSDPCHKISLMTSAYPSSFSHSDGNAGGRKGKSKVILVVILLLVAAGAYVFGKDGSNGAAPWDDERSIDYSKPLKIVAATELSDMEPFIKQASADLGFDIQMDYDSGTLVNTRNLLDGAYSDKYDATWFATDAFAKVQGPNPQTIHYSIARSPIALGIKKDVMDRLGWHHREVKWADIADAAARGDLTFGMTDPQESNSGFLTLLSVFAEFGHFPKNEPFDISKASINEPRLKDFFSGQTITSGSSGWLRDTFLKNPDKADGIFNYQSVLESMKENDGADIDVIIPGEATGVADYPISPLRRDGDQDAERDSQAKVRALSSWFDEHRAEVEEKTHLDAEPVYARNEEAESYYQYPETQGDIDFLNRLYHDVLRRPADSNFLLDTSGSMRGKRLKDLKAILTSLINGTAGEEDNPKGFSRRETIKFMPFSSKVAEGYTQEHFDPASAEQKRGLQDYVNGLQPRGETAIYDAVLQAYEQADKNGDLLSSIVLMTDGASNAGTNRKDFINRLDRKLATTKRKIPVFVILYGESSEEEMNFLAEYTGGKVFDARSGDMAKAFEEIRSYQ